MLMYQPTNLDVGGGGQVLDLETAVKDGILGGGGGTVTVPVPVPAPATTAPEKLDLKKMIDDLHAIEVPTVFICPISLEPMQDPVTLCTGQTYERSNILKWLSMGHLTCPTTMQELWDDSITPNRTLQHLILSWYSQKYLAMKKRSEDVQGRVVEILDRLKKKVKGQARITALKELRAVVLGGGSGGGVNTNNNNNKNNNTNNSSSSYSSSAKKTVMSNGGVAVLTSLLGPFTSHAVGSEVVGILVNLTLDTDSKSCLLQPAKVSVMVDMLNEGTIDTKINCTRLIESLIDGGGSPAATTSEVVSRLSLLVGLLRLIKDKRHPKGVQPGLSLLKAISTHEPACQSIVSIGAVPALIELLQLPASSPECLELVLTILDNVAGTEEGRLALKKCPNTIMNLVKLLMRVSEVCTQLALSVLWAVCKMSPEECAPAAVEAGLAAKLLLVIQSGCNPTLKQMSSELLKLCSLNYTATIFISKCKLTRTLQ